MGRDRRPRASVINRAEPNLDAIGLIDGVGGERIEPDQNARAGASIGAPNQCGFIGDDGPDLGRWRADKFNLGGPGDVAIEGRDQSAIGTE